MIQRHHITGLRAFSRQAFARQLADDLGFETPDEWPGSCIDWELAARELFIMGDYTSVRNGNFDVFVFRNS